MQCIHDFKIAIFYVYYCYKSLNVINNSLYQIICVNKKQVWITLLQQLFIWRMKLKLVKQFKLVLWEKINLNNAPSLFWSLPFYVKGVTPL